MASTREFWSSGDTGRTGLIASGTRNALGGSSGYVSIISGVTDIGIAGQIAGRVGTGNSQGGNLTLVYGDVSGSDAHGCSMAIQLRNPMSFLCALGMAC